MDYNSTTVKAENFEHDKVSNWKTIKINIKIEELNRECKINCVNPPLTY